MTGPAELRADSPQGRWVLLAAVLGSGMAILDGSVVNVALPRIGADLDASVSALQWVVNAYLLSLASLILVGGALGDRLGRRRVFTIGVAWFGAASVLCALAQTSGQLVAARLVQGVGAALLTPGSLALIQGSFRTVDRGRVIGRWAALGGIAAAVGPPLGGWVVDVASWRWIFWFNIPLSALIVWVTRRHVPESSNPESPAGYDLPGSALAVVGLGGVTYALIETGSPYAVLALVVGTGSLALFLLVQARSRHPVMPLHLFGSSVFSVANAMTFLVYGALGAMTFFLVLQLQVSVGYTPFEAGMATLPITLALLLLSSRAGALATRIGPRPLMTAGPVACGAGTWLLRDVARRERLPDGRAAGPAAVLARPGRPGRAADHDRARRGGGPVRRGGQRHQQRGRADRLAAGGRRAPRDGRDRRRGLPGPAGVHRGLRAGDGGLHGAARRRRAGQPRRPGRNGTRPSSEVGAPLTRARPAFRSRATSAWYLWKSTWMVCRFEAT